MPISKSLSKLANQVETPANKPQLRSTGIASFDRNFSSGELVDRDRSLTSIRMNGHLHESRERDEGRVDVKHRQHAGVRVGDEYWVGQLVADSLDVIQQPIRRGRILKGVSG